MMDSESSSISVSQSCMVRSIAAFIPSGRFSSDVTFSSRSNSFIAYQRARLGATIAPSCVAPSAW